MRYQNYSRQDLQKYRPKRSWRERFTFKKRRVTLHPAEAAFPTHQQARRTDQKFDSGGRRYRTLFIIFLLATVAWVVLLLALPYFRITDIIAKGNFNLLQSQEVAGVAQKLIAPHWWWPGNNYFLVRPQKIEISLKSKFLVLRAVSIKKVFPNQLKITVTEKSIALILDTHKQLFLVDEAGEAVKNLGPTPAVTISASTTTSSVTTTSSATSTATADASSTVTTSTRKIYLPPFVEYQKNYGNYLVVYDDQERPVVESTAAINVDVLRRALEIQKLAQSTLGATTNFVIIHGGGREGAELYLNKPWYVLFNPLQDIAPQMRRLQTILQNKKPIQYVDVRFGDHVYWK